MSNCIESFKVNAVINYNQNLSEDISTICTEAKIMIQTEIKTILVSGKCLDNIWQNIISAYVCVITY